MITTSFFNPENIKEDTIRTIVLERQKQKQIGKIIWIIIIIVGLIGSNYFGWLFFLFVIIGAFIIGSILGIRTGKKIERMTGLDINSQMLTWKYIQLNGLDKKYSTINPFNIIGKSTGIERKVKWSRGKMIQVYGPPFFGDYNIFVDFDFNVAVFLPKDDKTLHVFVGNIVKANRWMKFDSNGNKVLDKILSEGSFEWKINPKTILYRGKMLPPDQLVYKGRVINYQDFTEKIDDNWIFSMKNKFMKYMKRE